MLTILIALIMILGSTACKGWGRTDNPPYVPSDPTPSTTTPSPSQTPSTPTPSPTPSTPVVYEDLSLSAEELSALWLRTDGSTATIPLTVAINDAYGGGGSPPVHNTTSDAYRKLIYKEGVDLIIVTHPSEDEFALAREEGVELEVIPLVKDALVFLVNIENPVENISLAQLRDIYAGTITSWGALGGLNEDIIPYQRTKNSGSQTLLLKLVMNNRAPMDPPTEWVAESMGALVEIVSSYDNARNAIGYSVFYYVNNMYGNNQFKLLGIDGVKPSRDSIMRGEYPLEDNYYAVIRSDTPKDHNARKLIEWLLTDGGQALAAGAGYIPLRPMENVWPDEKIDPIYLGDVNNSSGTGGKTLKSTVDDIQPVNGVRPPLSDLFFDGFNFIQYINGEIIAQFDGVDLEGWFQGTWGEQYLRRPFTGIPNDYPNYEIYNIGYLIITFPNNNPFFGRAMTFHVLLTEDISPYGLGLPEFSVIYDYAGRMTPRVHLFTASVSVKDKPNVTARINERLESWINGFPDDGIDSDLLNDFIEWYGGSFGDDWLPSDWAYRLQPSVEIWHDYLSVSYILQLYDGPASNMPMVGAICFDIRTGEVVDAVSVLAKDLDYSNAYGVTIADFSKLNDWGWYEQDDLPSGYTPVAGSVITDAWILYGNINIYVTEPNGRVLQLFIWD